MGMAPVHLLTSVAVMRKVLVAGAATLMLSTGSGVADAARTPGLVDGIWRTDGYSMLIVVHGGHAQVYETTAVSCLPTSSVDQLGAPDHTGVVRFGAGGVVLATVRRVGRDRALLHSLGAVGHIGLLRLTGLPTACARPTPTDPVTSFDILWSTFAENYPFFEAKKIDWQAVRRHFRPHVKATTTDAQLYGIFVDMIKPLGDAHTDVAMDRQHYFEGQRPDTRPNSDELQRKVEKAVAAHLGVTLHTWANGQIAYADLPGGLGYLRISSFGGYTQANHYVTDEAALNQSLNAVFTTARTRALRGLIVDVRDNPGGDDALGIQVASRLTAKPYLAYAKRARNDPDDPSGHTRLQSIIVTPAHEGTYEGPVVLLTSDLTVSAGETFTQAMLGRTPRPTRIGAATQGVFSDVLNRTLPNGWTFGLPNEEYLTSNGKTFDGRGIPPDIAVPVFTHQELTQNRDSAVDTARRALSEARGAATRALRNVYCATERQIEASPAHGAPTSSSSVGGRTGEVQRNAGEADRPRACGLVHRHRLHRRHSQPRRAVGRRLRPRPVHPRCPYRLAPPPEGSNAVRHRRNRPGGHSPRGAGDSRR